MYISQMIDELAPPLFLVMRGGAVEAVPHVDFLILLILSAPFFALAAESGVAFSSCTKRF